jgi:hypothetical protein
VIRAIDRQSPRRHVQEPVVYDEQVDVRRRRDPSEQPVSSCVASRARM